MPAEFHLRRRVQFAETDMAGVLHFSNYFRLCEEVEHGFWRSVGHSVVLQDGEGHISWPRVSVSCAYMSPAHFEDELDLVFRVTETGRKSVSFEVSFDRDGARLALATIKAVCCEMRGGRFKSIEIPDDLRQLLETGRSGE
ncbi:MAG: acyl-CoA thioesterase [Phycisphaerales bacterium]|nr:acyl-CoA thioesterase [Phycisphaerales bacterium]